MYQDMTMVRIYLSEADPGKHGALLDEIFSVLHDEHRVHGVTVFRGISGFGRKGMVHSADLLRLNVHLPLVVEFFDEPEVIDKAIEALDELIPSGHLVRWTVQCKTG